MIHRFRITLYSTIISGLFFLFLYGETKAQFPEVSSVYVKRVFYNGEHNAFTDLIRFKGKYYLTFRS